MSRSIRNRHSKNGVYLKICGGGSDKTSKQKANRKFRRREHIEARNTLLNKEDYFLTTNINDVSNTWEFASDGLAIYIDLNYKNNLHGSIPENKRYRYKSK